MTGSSRLWIGAAITVLLIATALLGRIWTPADPVAMDIANRLAPPGPGAPFGTDQIGRDVLSIVMAGASMSLGTALAAVLLGGSLGTIIGLAGAALGGTAERGAMATMGVLFAFPPVLSAILLGALMGPGVRTAIVAIGLFMVPVFARIARGAAIQVWSRDYVFAARMAGKGRARISLEHVLPNIADQILVQVAIQSGLAILAEAGLSFLGMGAAPPNPSWGRMMAEAQTYLGTAPHLVLAPGLAIAIAVLGLNLLGDGLRDAMDPRRDQAA